MPKRSAFVRGLIERYREALSEEQTLVEAYESASRALADSRETKKLCAALLRKEGVDPETQDGISPAVARVVVEGLKALGGVPTTSSNGHSSGPLNATHAVYLLMRKRDNSGLSPEEIAGHSEEVGMKLSLQEVNKVVWTQAQKGRMEKLEDGRIRLTPKGEEFTSFRRKTEGEYQPMIQNFPTEAIK